MKPQQQLRNKTTHVFIPWWAKFETGEGEETRSYETLRVSVRENQPKMEIFGMCDVTEFNEIWG